MNTTAEYQASIAHPKWIDKAISIGDKEVRLIILSKYDGKCCYCGLDINITTLSIDHLLAKRRGAKDVVHGECSFENFMPACKSCNSSKSDWGLEKWRQELSLKVDRLMKYNSTFRAAVKFGLIVETNKKVTFYFERNGEEI